MNISFCSKLEGLSYLKCTDFKPIYNALVEKVSSSALSSLMCLAGVFQIYFSVATLYQWLSKEDSGTGFFYSAWVSGTLNSVLAIANLYFSLNEK